MVKGKRALQCAGIGGTDFLLGSELQAKVIEGTARIVPIYCCRGVESTEIDNWRTKDAGKPGSNHSAIQHGKRGPANNRSIYPGRHLLLRTDRQGAVRAH